MPAAPAPFRDEVLKSLERSLRKTGETQDRMVEVLQESHLTQLELVKVMKDLKRVLTVKDTVQSEMLDVLKEIRDTLKR